MMDSTAAVQDQPSPKTKQAHVRLTAEQERLLRQYCIRNRLSTSDAIVAALAMVIDGFNESRTAQTAQSHGFRIDANTSTIAQRLESPNKSA